MSLGKDDISGALDISDRSSFLDELGDFYRSRGYEVIAKDRDFPQNTDQRMGVVDLLLEDNRSSSYRVVKATKLEETDPSFVGELIEDKENQTEKARDYFSTNIDPEKIHTEVVIGTKGDLHAIKELLGRTTGVFTWEKAVEAVSTPGRLGNMRDSGEIVLNQSYSREEDEEYFELSPEMEPVIEALYEHRTYP